MTMNENDKQAEPVAWMKRTRMDGDNWDAYDFSANQHGDFITPLYTHPAQPVQPAVAQVEPVAFVNDKCAIQATLHGAITLKPGDNLYTAPPAAATNEQLLEALNDFSNYVRTEQSSTDGQVQYSNTQINRLAFKARAAIAAADQMKGGV